MIIEKLTLGSLPASKKVYVPGARYSDIRVPMREISLHPSSGEDAVTVYDTSGIYTDEAITPNIDKGLEPLRKLSLIHISEPTRPY